MKPSGSSASERDQQRHGRPRACGKHGASQARRHARRRGADCGTADGGIAARTMAAMRQVRASASASCRAPRTVCARRRHSRPAAVIRSVTFLLLSLRRIDLRGLQIGERHQLRIRLRRRCRRHIRRSCRSCRMSWPPLPVIHFRKACACSGCLLEASTPPPEMLTKAPGSWLLEIVQRDVLAVLAGLRLVAEIVIVIDHARLRSRRH